MTTWIPVIVAILSAVLAGRYAYRTKNAELQANRILELERRLAASKAEVFEPLIETLGKVFRMTAEGNVDEEAMQSVAGEPMQLFVHWVQIYGSDDTVRVVHRLMQAMYHDPPPEVVLRLMAELIVAARRELGHSDTEIDAVDVMGLRITDTYENGVPAYYLRVPENELYAALNWSPPWGERYGLSRGSAPQLQKGEEPQSAGD